MITQSFRNYDRFGKIYKKQINILKWKKMVQENFFSKPPCI